MKKVKITVEVSDSSKPSAYQSYSTEELASAGIMVPDWVSDETLNQLGAKIIRAAAGLVDDAMLVEQKAKLLNGFTERLTAALGVTELEPLEELPELDPEPAPEPTGASGGMERML